MLNPELFLAFLAVSVIVIIVPGPNVTLIIATATLRGTRAGLATVAGTSAAQAIQMMFVAGGLIWLLELYGSLFDAIRLLGAAYLVWLGYQAWRHAGDPLPENLPDRTSMKRGFLVGLANPKTIAFQAAFIPQFIDPALAPGQQFTILCLTFLLLATILDGCYAVLGGYAGRFMTGVKPRLWLGRLSGATLALGGVWLATLRRT